MACTSVFEGITQVFGHGLVLQKVRQELWDYMQATNQLAEKGGVIHLDIWNWSLLSSIEAITHYLTGVSTPWFFKTLYPGNRCFREGVRGCVAARWTPHILCKQGTRTKSSRPFNLWKGVLCNTPSSRSLDVLFATHWIFHLDRPKEFDPPGWSKVDNSNTA